MVNIGLRVLARPQATMLPDMYRKLGIDFDERVLPSIMNEVHVQVHIIHVQCISIIFSKTTSITFYTVMALLWLVFSTPEQKKNGNPAAQWACTFQFSVATTKIVLA